MDMVNRTHLKARVVPGYTKFFTLTIFLFLQNN